MKRHIFLSAFCSSLMFYSCITEFNSAGIEDVGDILVVEGIITDNETNITLSKSVGMMGEEWRPTTLVNNAKVYVECDDGTITSAEPDVVAGKYLIKTGKLDLERKYRLKIEIEELDSVSDNHLSKTYEYCSDYSNPIETPQIDSVFWTKNGEKQPVNIYVATHDPWNRALHYRWSFAEEWEIHSEYFYEKFPFYCWNSSNNKDLLMGSSGKTVFGQLTDKITELSPHDRKLEVLYRITVKQNTISKRAYDYFTNIEKNAKQTGGIFSPIPSELRGNITCTTDLERPVIGYVDVSTTTKSYRFISRTDGVYEPIPRLFECDVLTRDCISVRYPDLYLDFLDNFVRFIDEDGGYPEIVLPPGKPFYILIECVDCAWKGRAYTNIPDDWPVKN